MILTTLLTIFSNCCTGSWYRNVLNTKSYPPFKCSSSLLLHVTCTISLLSSFLNPLDHLHLSLISNHQLTPVSSSQTAPSGMLLLHLICGTSFLLLFMFFISSILHYHPALLHRHALITDRLLAFLVAFSTLVLKLFFSQSFSLHSHLSLPQADLLEL